ncbi:hypothetical protein KM043_007183 [Ampulex compressa]|nr:hypothetical protein KM043_007183 [Ampulex compressa]
MIKGGPDGWIETRACPEGEEHTPVEFSGNFNVVQHINSERDRRRCRVEREKKEQEHGTDVTSSFESLCLRPRKWINPECSIERVIYHEGLLWHLTEGVLSKAYRNDGGWNLCFIAPTFCIGPSKFEIRGSKYERFVRAS